MTLLCTEVRFDKCFRMGFVGISSHSTNYRLSSFGSEQVYYSSHELQLERPYAPGTSKITAAGKSSTLSEYQAVYRELAVPGHDLYGDSIVLLEWHL